MTTHTIIFMVGSDLKKLRSNKKGPDQGPNLYYLTQDSH